MLELQIKGHDVKIPQTAHEIEFRHFCRAWSEYDKAISQIKEDDDDEIMNLVRIEAAVRYCDALLPDLTPSVYELLPLDIDKGDADLTGFRFGAATEAGNVSLLRLYSHFQDIFYEFDHSLKDTVDLSKPFSFHHEGEQYFFNAQAILRDKDLSTAQVIEVNEMRRIAEKKAVEGEDKDKSFHFTALVAQGAILWRLEGEALPLNMELRQRFIYKRIAQFERLDYATVKEIDFFLTCITLSMLMSTQRLTTSKAHQKGGKLQGKKKANIKQSKGKGLKAL